MLTCDVAQERGGAYVLGALESDEAAEIERHVEGCTDCREWLAAEQTVAAALSLSVPQVEPPSRLRAAIMAAARDDARPVGRDPWWRRLFPSPTRAALGAASLASLGFVAMLSWALTLQSQVVARPVAPASAAAPVGSGGGEWGDWALSRADMKRLNAADTAPEARGWIYVDPSSDSALLVAYKLPPLPPDRGYQLWLVKDGQRASGGIFTVDGEGYGWLKVQAPQAFGTYQRVGITIEPRTGSPGPTGARVLGGDL